MNLEVQDGRAAHLARRYSAVRAHSLALSAGWSAEDQQVQSMPDASPTKWHLAHTSWFFETLVLRPHAADYAVFDPEFAFLFNSYYEALGPRHPRPQRGLLTRPPLARVLAYRQHVDTAISDLLQAGEPDAACASMIELGVQHEQQHQELMLTDLMHAFWSQPTRPSLLDRASPIASRTERPPAADAWAEHPGGQWEIGHDGAGFCFDNERPRHRVWIEPFAIARDLVRNRDLQGFIDAGGYREPRWWLSDGWARVQTEGWVAPAYWLDEHEHAGMEFTEFGVQRRDPDRPVSQISFYEAEAFAAWAGARLPTEAEWELAASRGLLNDALDQRWQWTRSSYEPYPGYRPAAGAVGEYNGKSMFGQRVLRGGSIATPPGHARATYRNFFPPEARWQFSGLRLARDL